MINHWELLKSELGIFGIGILDKDNCSFLHENKRYKSSILIKRKLLYKKFKENTKIIQELFCKMCDILSSLKNSIENTPIDTNLIKLFVFSIKDSYKLANFFNDLPIYNNFFTKEKILEKLRISLNKDYLQFNKEVIISIPDIKIAIDSLFRKNQLFIYLDKMLSLIQKGENKLNGMLQKQSSVNKFADGINGPWSNLDLPMLERKFPWDDIEEETRGRDKDIRMTKRYRMGLENYAPGTWLSESYVWREIKNEPYSWETRFENGNLPQLSPGAWR